MWRTQPVGRNSRAYSASFVRPSGAIRGRYFAIRLLLHATDDATIAKAIEFIHEGRYAAEVPVDLIEDNTGWSPYLSAEDAKMP